MEWDGICVDAADCLPALIEYSIAQFAPYAWNRVSITQAFDSYTEMVEAALYPLLALFVFALGMTVVEKRAKRMCPDCRGQSIPRWMQAMMPPRDWDLPEAGPCERNVPGIPLHDAAGSFCFMAYPFIGYGIASIRGAMLSPRFVIPVCFEFASAGTLTAYRLFGGMRRAGFCS